MFLAQNTWVSQSKTLVVWLPPRTLSSLMWSTSNASLSSSSYLSQPHCKGHHCCHCHHRCHCHCHRHHPVVEFNCLVGGKILLVSVVVVNHPPDIFWYAYSRYIVVWIAQTVQRQTILQEAWLILIRVEEDRIIAHGVVLPRLIDELDLEVVQAQRVQVYDCNMALIEAAIVKVRPPIVRDIQAEANQRLHPFQVDGDELDDSARHCKQRRM
jgi:hypothetical protein